MSSNLGLQLAMPSSMGLQLAMPSNLGFAIKQYDYKAGNESLNTRI